MFPRKLLASLVAVALVLCLAPESWAQEKAADDGKAAARSAVPAKGADALLFVINDPLPHLKALLGSESLRKTLTEGAFGELVAMIPFAPALDPRIAWEAIDENRRYVPTEIAIGLSQESVAQLDRLVRAGLLAALCYGANDSDDDAAEKDLPKLQDEFLKVLKEVGVPPMTVFVRLREEEDAERLFDVAQGQVRSTAEEAGYEVIEIDDGAGIGLRGKVGDKMPEEGLDEVLELLGVNEAKRPEFRKAIAELKIETWLQRKGSTLTLTVGPRPAAKAAPFTTAQLGPLYRQEERDILFARWDATKLKAAVKSWVELWKTWEKSPAGKRLKELDTENTLGDLFGSTRTVERMSNSGSMRMWADDDALRGASRSEGVPPAADLQGAAISRYVPKDAEAFSLDSTTSLADALAYYLDQFETRMSLQSLRAVFDEGDARGRIAEELSANYYKHFAEFRKNVLERMYEAVGGPSASVVTTTGKVERFSLSFSADGETKKFDLKDLPMFELAGISRAKDAKRADDVLAGTYQSFVEGLYAVMDKTLPKDAPPVVERDLGLGVKTRVFTGGWIKPLTGDFELEMSLEGDFVPHFFVHDGHLIVSTSPKLSKRLLAAAKAKDSVLPPTKTGYQRTVAHGVMPGRTLGNVYAHTVAWMAEGVRAAGGEEAGVPVDIINKAGKGIAELFALIERVEWTTSEKPGVQDSEFAVRWGKR